MTQAGKIKRRWIARRSPMAAGRAVTAPVRGWARACRAAFAPGFLLALASLFMMVAGAMPACAEVRDLAVTVMPSMPVWPEAVVLDLQGMSDCFPNRLDGVVQGGTIEVTVSEQCGTASGDFHHFQQQLSLGHLAPGSYTLQVDAGDLGTALPPFDFQVYAPSTTALAEQFAPVYAGGPALLFLQVLTGASCSGAPAPSVAGGVIRVDLGEECFAAALPHVYQTLPLELPALPAGDFELQVLQQGSPPKLLKQPLHVYAAGGCMTTDIALCLNGDRFRVATTWRGFQGRTGIGHPVALAGRDDTGLFWFFDEANLELTVKVLDGCGVNDHYWVFIASGSTVEYEVTVTDTDGDEVKTYRNELGHTPRLIADTTAFACP